MAKTRRTNKTSGSVKQMEALPVGTLVHSMLSLAQFQAQMGSNWVVADGTSSVGTDYNIITGFPTIPDCRALFLRGLDLGKGGDVGRNLGTFQADSTASNGLTGNAVFGGGHGHTYTRSAGGSLIAASGSSWGVGTEPGVSVVGDGSHSHTLSIGSSESETRPDNIAVYIFIKINDN